MASNRNKRRRAGQPPGGGANDGPATDVLGLDILLECLSYLPIADVNAASITCTAWRDFIWQSASIWEGLLVQKYPSHADLPKGWCTSGREEYLRRMTLMKCQYAPVRSLPGLPIPLQRKTPSDQLMERWKPDSIIFLVDVFTGRNHFDDDLPVDPGPVKEKKRLGPQVLIFSQSFPIYAPDRRGNITGDQTPLTYLDERAFDQYAASQLESETLASALEAILLFHDATAGSEESLGIDDVGGLYVEMSYYVDGGSAPKCDPIVLLSEHHTFFVEQDDARVIYRTDVEPCWLPGRDDWDDSESVFNKKQALRWAKVVNRQISKYSSVPLPFDPEMELTLSPPGERSIGDLWDWEGEPVDSELECSIRVKPGFSIGEDYDCDFAGLVVPNLLSLWNDYARQKERKSFRRFA